MYLTHVCLTFKLTSLFCITSVYHYHFIQVELDIRRDCGPTMSLGVAEMICSMPSLEKLSLQGAFHHCFFATLAKKGTESKVSSSSTIVIYIVYV